MDATSLLMVGLVPLLCCLFYLGQILIHMCVHASLFRSRFLNEAVGTVLCSMHLVHFEGWRTAHMMHHLHTNTERDPHRVDRGMIPYIITHYFRIARVVWEPRRFLAAVSPPLAIAIGVVVWQVVVGHGALGLLWVCAYWVVPLMISHALVAHFNYITHVGLPPERGQNTRNLRTGIWRAINALTFNFYLHAEHHLRPSQQIPRTRESEETSTRADPGY